MVYELFMFNNEVDLLEIKLEELYDFVDKFIIIESTHTHSNLPKPLHYVENEHRFAKYKDKIIHLTCNFNDTHMYRTHRAVYDKLKVTNEIWYREHFQRDFGVISGQIQFNDDDIIIVTDLDEIVNKHAVSKFIKETGVDKIYRLGMALHYYKFNLRVPYPILWRHSYIARYKHLKEFNFALSYVRHNYKFDSPEYYDILVEDTGWHFSYLMSADDIVNKKHKQFAHAEDDYIQVMSVDDVERNIDSKRFYEHKLKECTLSELPETVVKLSKYVELFERTHP